MVICKICKEDKKHGGRGRCRNCYSKWYLDNNPKQREIKRETARIFSRRKLILEKAREKYLKKLKPEHLIQIVENGKKYNNNFRERN